MAGRGSAPGAYQEQHCTTSCAGDCGQGCPNRAESRGSASRFAIRSKRAPRRFGDSAIRRFLGLEGIDLTGPGQAGHNAGATPHKRHRLHISEQHLGATSRSNKFLSGLICIVKEFPRKFEPMRYLVTCSGCSAASRLLRLCLSACGARQAAPMHAYRRTPHLRVHCIDAATVLAPRCHPTYST